MVVQARALDRWSDGSVRWALLDFTADVHEDAVWRVVVAPDLQAPQDDRVIRVTEGSDVLMVDTAAAAFAIDPARAFPLARVTRGGADVIADAPQACRVVGAEGASWAFQRGAIAAMESGPLRTVVSTRGAWMGPGGVTIESEFQIEFFAGLSTVRCAWRLRNPRAAAHAGGYWDLGDPGSVQFREVALTVAAAASGTLAAQVDETTSLGPVEAPWALTHLGSGGEAWRSPTHVDASGLVKVRARGYEIVSGGRVTEGLRATPVLTHQSDRGLLGIAVPQFWQQFPRALQGDARGGLTFMPWPDIGEPYELQGGEQKTHRFSIAFGPDPVTDAPLAWCVSPTVIRADVPAYVDAGAAPRAASAPHPRAADYTALVSKAFDGDRSFFAKREAVDEYGWRDFGDLPADHEAARHAGPDPFVSHYNNQYDAVAAFAVQFMRTGDARAWTLMDDLARHVVDIDIYHTDQDRAAYSHGLFWHTNHYTPAATATHRAYARSSGLPGGGPSNEHNYTTGLMLHYFLTGSSASAAAVVELAEWVLAMDDGARSRFRWIDRGPTGLASATYSPGFHGPGRGAGNSINALMDAHRLTGQARFLDAAEALIRRSIHPADDPAMHDLLDAERRWSYAVFLQVLGSYLDRKRDLGTLDAMYVYARESLLTYARWMVAHEVPVLDRPDRVEFPTETWAAQDLRKADVLNTARRYAADTERARLAERRDFFFDYAVRTLSAMPTADCTRPLVLLLVNGPRVAYGDLDERVAADGPAPAFTPRRPFEPQRPRVVRRLVIVAAAVVVAGMTAVLLSW